MDLTAGDLANALKAMERAQWLLLDAYVEHGMITRDVRDHLSTAAAPLSRALYRLKVEVTNG